MLKWNLNCFHDQAKINSCQSFHNLKLKIDATENDAKKRVLLISGVEKQNDDVEDDAEKTYDATFQFNDVRETIEFVYDGNVDANGKFDGYAVLSVIQVPFRH